jgi:ribosomal protein S18 acetylase RimI-like enzyme
VPKSPQFSTVAAADGDLPAVAALAGTIWRRHYPGIISTEQIEYMLERGYAPDVLRRFIAEPGAGIVLLYAGSRLVGFVAYCRLDVLGEMKLDKLYVHQDFHKSGCGRRLIACVEAAARAAGCDTLVLNVNKGNAMAIHAYERNGFGVREEVVVDIGGGFVMDDYVMAKSLAARAEIR